MPRQLASRSSASQNSATSDVRPSIVFLHLSLFAGGLDEKCTPRRTIPIFTYDLIVGAGSDQITSRLQSVFQRPGRTARQRIRRLVGLKEKYSLCIRAHSEALSPLS